MEEVVPNAREALEEGLRKAGLGSKEREEGRVWVRREDGSVRREARAPSHRRRHPGRHSRRLCPAHVFREGLHVRVCERPSR
jgi:hypothetical protein